MRKRLSLLFLSFLLVFISQLRASTPIGAVVQGSHYDSAKGVVTFDLLNTSHKDITAFSLLVRASHTDGTASTWEYGGDFLPHLVETGSGALAPGAVFTVDVPLGQQQFQKITATADVVVYIDGTADVLNQSVFQSIASQRKGRVLGLQKANELLTHALADPGDEHPSVTVAAQLKALAKQYETNPPSGAEFEATGLLVAATNISNAPKSPTGRSEKEDAYLRTLIKTHQDRVSLMLPHTQLTQAVRPWNSEYMRY